MFLDEAHRKWGWPSRDEVLSPTGTGPKLTAELAEKKLGNTIRLLPGGQGVRVGIL